MQAHSPKINVITVTKNNAKGLKKTLASIVNLKNENDIKLFIIDGGSTDGTLEVIKKYSRDIYFHESSKDNGIYDAMNKAIRVLPDEDDSYSIFINSDDILLRIPQLLAELKYEAAFYPTISYDPPSGLRREFQIDSTVRIHPRWMIFPKLHHQGCFVKTSTLKIYQFNELIGIRADVALMLKIIADGNRCFFGSIPVAEITTGGASDKYNIENLASFFRVARYLNQSVILVVFFNLHKILKYFVKILIGNVGITFVRRVHRLVLS